MNRGRGKITVEQEVVNQVGLPLRIDEDDSATRWHGEEEVIKRLVLCRVLNPDDPLVNVVVRGTGAAYTNADVVLSQVLTSEGAGLLGEGRREHEVDVVGILIVIFEMISVRFTKEL